MLDRNTLIALVIVGLIVLLIPSYYKLVAPPASPIIESVTDTTKPVKTAEKVGDEALKAVPAETSSAILPASDDSASLAPSKPYSSELVEIETPKFKLMLGSDARPTSYILNEYKLKAGPPVNLHALATAKDSAIGAWDLDLGPRNVASLTGLYFEPSTPRLFVPSGRDSVELGYISPSGQHLIVY